MWTIPLSNIDFDEREEKAALAVLRSKWLTMGETTKRFEGLFARQMDVAHAWAVSNCTLALEIAYKALGIGPGDEVIVPSLTFVATANAVVAVGARPVFADITDRNDLTISPADVEAKITPKVKAITVVHYAGFPCDMDAILSIARRAGIAVIEDCAHSPGARYRGRPTGSIGDIGCFSFFSNKNMTTGEGGMITTNRDDLAMRVHLLRSHGMTSATLDRHKGHASTYDVVEFGTNARLDELRAAIGIVQLGKLRDGNEARRTVSEWYRAALARVTDLKVPFSASADSAHHIFPVLLPDAVDRARVQSGMKQAGVQTSIHYPPVHRFSRYRAAGSGNAMVPRTSEVADHLLTLPLYPAMSHDDVLYVSEAIRRCLT